MPSIGFTSIRTSHEMSFLLIFFISSILIVIIFCSLGLVERKKIGLNTLQRFKKRFKNRNPIKDRLIGGFSDALMTDPEKNIKIGTWDDEFVLREKADIHRARLNRYGRSKINGEMIFMGSKGGVYKKTEAGNKKYV